MLSQAAGLLPRVGWSTLTLLSRSCPGSAWAVSLSGGTQKHQTLLNANRQHILGQFDALYFPRCVLARRVGCFLALLEQGPGWAGCDPQHGVQGGTVLPGWRVRRVRGADRSFLAPVALVFLGLPPHAYPFSPSIAAPG